MEVTSVHACCMIELIIFHYVYFLQIYRMFSVYCKHTFFISLIFFKANNPLLKNMALSMAYIFWKMSRMVIKHFTDTSIIIISLAFSNHDFQ